MERPHITQQQFTDAYAIAIQMGALAEAREKAVASNTVDRRFVLSSDIWEQQNELFLYCMNPSYEVVDTWRSHTIIFTGNYLGYAVLDPEATPKRLRRRYAYFTKGLPHDLIVRPPDICAERGWRIHGDIINIDSIMIQRHIAALYRSGAISYLRSLGHLRILEIGGGYGGLALALKKILPDSEYYMVDIPESLVFAAVYLRVIMPDQFDAHSVYDGKDPSVLSRKNSGFTFVSNFLVSDLIDQRKFDLVINTGSLGEMTDYQIDTYAATVAAVMDRRGIFYEENGDTNRYIPKVMKKHFQKLQLIGFERIWAHDFAVLDKIVSFGKDIKLSAKTRIIAGIIATKTFAKGIVRAATTLQKPF